MRTCQRCVLPASFPGADLDADGVCAYCRRDRATEASRERQREGLRARFRALCSEHRGRGPYDCLLAWSGGKDSTYTLSLLRRRYGLRVLAYTFDNGFVAPQAMENMRRISEALGVDHVIVRPRFDLLRVLFFRAAERPEAFSLKALTRASGVCNACMGMAKGVGLQLALRHAVPIIAYGWSPGQAPVSSALFRRSAGMYRPMVDALMEPLQRLADDDVSPYFPAVDDWERVEVPPLDVAPLLFCRYDEAEIADEIGALGWRRPPDTDPNSSNCLLNAYGNAMHRARFGFHPYALELANLVRLGVMARHEALARLEEPEDPAVVAMVRLRLGVADAGGCYERAVATTSAESIDRTEHLP